jgi:low temperature requirement protein LtrA
MAGAAALWWAYFDVTSILAQRKLEQTRGVARAVLARDAYSYLHLPLVAGVVLFALGLKKTLGHVGEPLDLVAATGLCGGLALYFLAQVAIQLRTLGTLKVQRLAAAAVLAALVPLATDMAALTALALAAAVACGLVAYETIRFREARLEIRHAQA